MDSLTKVYNRKTNRAINYTGTVDIIKELRILEKQKGWAIFEALKTLRNGKADSFSFTKDRPYEYFYARMTRDIIIVKHRTKDGETEFKIPSIKLVF